MKALGGTREDTPRQRQEDRAGAERIHDREQSAENQEESLYRVVHRLVTVGLRSPYPEKLLGQ